MILKDSTTFTDELGFFLEKNSMKDPLDHKQRPQNLWQVLKDDEKVRL